ncbi:MAG: glycoside hydrolase family 5 protein [Planctomycetes bacterium]|nr:glycoside hydrolase family 5 protein [Planctomycetota bacterium]
MRTARVWWLPAILAAGAGCAPLRSLLTGPKPRGLTVARDGSPLREGKPFRGIGVNYFDAFYRTLRNPNDTSYFEGFAELARLRVPFARFMACGFWPNDWELYFVDRERYYHLLDGVVRAAEQNRVGLIPCLFWASATVPDLVGEPRGEWANPESKTHAFMRNYVREVVTRYRRSPAIWGWEFGNEYSLDADLPNAAQHRPAVVPKLGTPEKRSEADDLTHDALAVALAAFAQEVRKHDGRRIISSGNSLPRPSAWHQWKEKSWAQDTEEQFAERLRLDNPDPVNTLSVHVYEPKEKRFGRETPVEELLRLAVDVAVRAGKPLFVGEFGAPGVGPEAEKGAKERLAALIAAIEKADVPLAALWVYDFAGQAKDWSVTASNARSWQLAAITEANERMKARTGE